MKKMLLVSIVLTLFLAICALGNAQKKKPHAKPALTETAVSKNFKNLSFSVGETKRTAALYVPQHYDSSKKWPLIIFLHGGGGDGDNHGDAVSWARKTSQIAKVIEKHPEWFPALVLIPRCPKGKIWAPGPKDPIQSPWRLKHHGADPVPDASDHVTTAIDETIAN